MARLIKCQAVLSVKRSTTYYIGESLRAFRSTLQIGHATSVQKKTDEKKPKAVHAGKNLAPSPCLSLSPALCVLLVRRVACVRPSLIVGKLPSISMSLSFGILASVVPLSSCGCLSLPTATRRRTRSPVRVRFCRCLGDLPGMHTASGVYTSAVFTHACTHCRSCSDNSSHSSGKTLRFECDKRTRTTVRRGISIGRNQQHRMSVARSTLVIRLSSCSFEKKQNKAILSWCVQRYKKILPMRICAYFPMRNVALSYST